MERPPLPTPGTTLHLLRLLYLFGLLAAGGCESRQGPELGSGKAAFAARATPFGPLEARYWYALVLHELPRPF